MNEMEQMRYGICNETYVDWSLPEVCRDIADAGYTGIEIAPFTIADPVEQIDLSVACWAGQVAQDAGLEIIGLHWLLSRTKGLHLSSPDRSVRDATVEFVSKLARCCHAMGGNIMVWGGPQQRSYPEGQSHAHAMDCAADVISRACRVAGELGVTIALEPLAPRETNFLNTAAETVELIQRIDHPACRLHLDVKAMSAEEDAIPQIITRYANYLAHFHANDPNLRGPGMGDTDFNPIFAALRNIGYDGYVSVEVFDYEPDGPTIARQSIEYLRQVEQATAI